VHWLLKGPYCNELLVSNMLSVAKTRIVELSVAKDHVYRGLHIATASFATAGVCCYKL
jgi:hypothetical protein